MFKQRTFKCLSCGCIRQAPKKRQTQIGHIKTMYCPVCKAVRDFEQVNDNRIGARAIDEMCRNVRYRNTRRK